MKMDISISDRLAIVLEKCNQTGLQCLQVGLWSNHPDDGHLTMVIIFSEKKANKGENAYRKYHYNHSSESFSPYGEYVESYDAAMKR